jgi:RNA ligase (TIGR02306 family)
MATKVTVPIVTLENVRPHPNADRLEICDVLGYQMCVHKGKYQNGDIAIYFPADTLIPAEWAERFGVTQFLRGKQKDRVGQIRLRGEPSFGLVVSTDHLDHDGYSVGDNVAEVFGAEKWQPPIRMSAGDSAPHDSDIDPFFTRFTDIENGRIHTHVFSDGEEVVATEKIHGTNCRVGIISGQRVAGSMGIRRQEPPAEEMHSSTYWYPWTLECVQSLLAHLAADHEQVLLYGEVFGGSIQSMHYGIEKGRGVGFRAVDIVISGRYLDWDRFNELCTTFQVPAVPVLYRGPYSLDKMKELADGASQVGGEHIREGIVVRPLSERTDAEIGRAVLKYIGTEYALSKHSDFTDV